MHLSDLGLLDPTLQGMLLIGTLFYLFGGLVFLRSALRRHPTEPASPQTLATLVPNPAAQKVASSIESLAVYSAWHAANQRSFMFDDAARDLEARERAAERLRALLPSELAEAIIAVAWHAAWHTANTRRWLYWDAARDKGSFEDAKRRLRRQLGLKPSTPRPSRERAGAEEASAPKDLAEAICQLCWAGSWHAANTRSMKWISAARDAWRFGETSCRLLVLLQESRAFNSLLERTQQSLEASARYDMLCALPPWGLAPPTSRLSLCPCDSRNRAPRRDSPASPPRPRLAQSAYSSYALGLAFGSHAVAKLARDAESPPPGAPTPGALPPLTRRASSPLCVPTGGGTGGGGGGHDGPASPHAGASAGAGAAETELSVLRRNTSALDDVTAKWRAVQLGECDALPCRPFLEAAYATISIFDSLGSAVGGCKKDMKKNADALHAYLGKHPKAASLQMMVQAEVEELGVAAAATGKSGSSSAATLALLWLARFLRVLERFLAATSADPAAPLSACITDAYDSALKPHHTWVTQSVIGKALKFSPSREEFYCKLGADRRAVEQGVRDLLAVYSPPLAVLQAFMLAEGLEKPDL